MTFFSGYDVKLLLLVLGMVAVQFTLQAHTNEYLDTVGGEHGGMLRMSGPYHLELVVTRGEAVIWLMDHGNEPQPTAGVQGELVLFQNGDRITVDLEPQGESELHGTDTRIEATASPRAVLTLSPPGEAPMQVRFSAIKKRNDHDAHTH